MSTAGQAGLRSLAPGTGETLWVLGDRVTLLADGEQEGLTMLVATIPPGGGPPPHVHYQQEEAHCGHGRDIQLPEWQRLDPGACRDVRPHPARCRPHIPQYGDAAGRLISTDNLPGSHERWFRHVGVPIHGNASFRPPKTAPDMDDVLRSAAEQDIVMVLPAESRQQG